MKKTGVSTETLKESKTKYLLTFSFNIMTYKGKYKESKKAVDVKLEKCESMGAMKGRTAEVVETPAFGQRSSQKNSASPQP